jgi:putative transposase
MRILTYCVMPNHWHLVLYPKKDADLSAFMQRVTTTHVRQRRTSTATIGHGHLQGTYKSFPVAFDRYLQQLILYVEQNPLRATLVWRAEDWGWSGLWRRVRGSGKEKQLLSPLPTTLPQEYLRAVNTLLKEEDIERLRRSLNKGAPYGGDAWVTRMADRYAMGSTLRKPGRPKSTD